MKNNLFLLFFMLCTIAVYAQELTPLEVVKNVFTDYCFMAEIPKHSTDRYDGTPNVSTINRAYESSFKVLEQDAKTAVVNMTLDSMGYGKDTYIYLKKKEVWKITAFTALPRNNIEYQERGILEAINTEEDHLLATFANDASQKKLLSNRDYIRFTFALDDQIIDYFKANENQFKQIAKELERQHILEKEVSKGASLEEYISTDFSNLFIPSISVSEFYEGCYDFFIGGMVYSRLGYFYIPDEKNVPKMDSSSLILLREIEEGWYLYKRL